MKLAISVGILNSLGIICAMLGAVKSAVLLMVMGALMAGAWIVMGAKNG